MNCGYRNITFGEMEALIAELAKKYKDDHKLEEDAAKEQIAQKLAKTKSKSHGTTVRFCYYYHFIRRYR